MRARPRDSRARGREPGRPSAADAGEVRIGPVAAIPDVLRKLGVTPSLPFVRAGVRSPRSRIPRTGSPSRLWPLVFRMLDVDGCGHFGLLVGECFDLNGSAPSIPDAKLAYRWRGAAGTSSASLPA